MTTAQESLMALGFTGLEADIYVALAGAPAMTGYRIAQIVGKPVANVYKAIESLQSKGAIEIDNSGNRFCKATPPAELLSSFERRFEEEIDQAEKSLSRIAAAKSDERTYELLTRDQVYERTRELLNTCKEVALLDMFPQPFELLKEEILRCAKRGVVVAAMSYTELSLPGVHIVVNPDGEAVRKRWPGQWLNLVVDAKEHLLSFLSSDGNGVLQAVWSASPYLSWIYHCGLTGEMMAMSFIAAVQKKASSKEFARIVEQFGKIREHRAPGYKEVIQKFGLEKSLKPGPRARRRAM